MDFSGISRQSVRDSRFEVPLAKIQNLPRVIVFVVITSKLVMIATLKVTLSDKYIYKYMMMYVKVKNTQDNTHSTYCFDIYLERNVKSVFNGPFLQHYFW